MPVWGTGPKRTDGRTNPQISATPVFLLPNQVSNLSLWFDAADISTVRTNISSLNTWQSKTPISTVMSNAQGLLGATWRSTTQNSLPVVRFNDSNSFMSSFRTNYPSANFVTSNETTMFLAYNPTNNGAPFGILDTANYGAGGVRYHPQCGQSFFFGNIFTDPQSARLDYSYTVNTGFKVETYLGRQSTLSFRNNGTLFATSTMLTGLSFPNQNNVVIMGGLSYGLRPFTQDIGEALLYNRGLSDIEIIGIEAYLSIKWGVRTSLPFNHPARITGPPLMGYRFPPYQQVVSNYGLWYDAMDTSTIKDTGGNFPPSLPPNPLGVVEWRDKSGNARHLQNYVTQPSFFNLLGNNFYPNVNSPGYTRSTDPLSGYNNLRGPQGAATSIYNGSSISAFFVLSIQSNATNNTFFSITSSVNTQNIPINPNGPNVSTFDFSFNYISNTIGFSRFGGGGQFGTQPRDSNNVLTAPLPNITSNNLITIMINPTPNTIGNVLPSTNIIEVNRAFVSSSTRYAGNQFNFIYYSMFGAYNFPANSFSYFNEVGIFFRTLTTAERVAYESQLIRKWGIQSNAPITYINSLPVTSGLFGWYDAYDQTTVLRNSSNNVSMWLDKSGQNNHMSTNLLTFGSNTGSNIYYSSISISTNQFPSLFFPSTFAFMQTSTLITNQNLSSITMIAVKRGIKIPDGPQPRTVSLFSTLGSIENGGGIIGAQFDSIQNNTVNNTQFAANYSTFHINTLLGNIGPFTENDVASRNAVTYYNGANAQTTTGLPYSGNLYPSYIRLMSGGFNDQANADTRADAGFLGEVLIYNRILNSNELLNTHTYLLNKWGISTVVSNVPVTSGLNLWLDCYDPTAITTDSNNNVLLWRDKSLFRYHMSNFGGNVGRPKYTTNPAGLPSIFFDITNNTNAGQGLVNSNIFISSISSITIFVAKQYINPTATTLSQIGGTNYATFLMALSTPSFGAPSIGASEFSMYDNNANSTYFFRSTINAATQWGFTNNNNTNLLLTTILNSSTAPINDIGDKSIGFVLNGNSRNVNFIQPPATNTDAGTTSTINTRILIIGNNNGGGFNNSGAYNGYINEVLFYNRALTFSERQQVESYLLSKWNI